MLKATALRAGVVGAGRMGRIRALAARSLGVEILAICDPDMDRARALAADCAIPVAVADEDDLPWDDLDMLFLCTPPSVRSTGARAIRSGVHLLVEKPLATTAADAEPLLAALEACPVVTAVGYMNRYREGVLALRARLRQERVLGAVAHWAGGRYRVPWWADPGQSGGPLNEQATHLVDLLRFLLGEVEAVRVLVPGGGSDAESAAIALRFTDDRLATILYSCEAEEKLIGLRVFTPHAEHSLLTWEFLPGPDPAPCPDRNAVFLDETRAFVEAIQGRGDGVRSDLRDALQTQRVMDSIRLRAAAGI
ncbi:MAG: Gfo/Idh/MocA family oxidoreductase [Pseudomonadota bacterium]